MRISIACDNFPMGLLECFKDDLSHYVDANIQVEGKNSVSVSFKTDDVARAECAVAICDKYRFGGGDNLEEDNSS